MTTPITILNIRRGFANNSSSSHSMIVLDRPAASVLKEQDTGDFGWSAFTLTQHASKTDYLIALLGGAIARDAGEIVASEVLKDLGLLDPSATTWCPSGAEGVDHQSQVYLPRNADQSGVDLQFAQDFVNWALQDHIAILGGNDNDGEHPDEDKGLAVSWRNLLAASDVVSWKDPETGAWSLFSRRNGLMLRLSFDDVSSLEDNSALRWSEIPADRPNLVDVKITDRCPFACAYCYQGSTPKAPHASLAAIVEIADRLAAQKVFEVALGGGEPTLHPDFPLIVSAFRQRDITPNVTTRNLAWLKSQASISTLHQLGGIAVSVDTLSGASAALDAIAAMRSNMEGLNAPSMSLQLVVGSMPEQVFKDICSLVFARAPDNGSSAVKITLLGYKTTGLGQSFKQSADHQEQIATAQDNWVSWIFDAHQNAPVVPKTYRGALWVCIDTALAQISDSVLKTMTDSRRMYHRVEGSQSMYIDAVRQVMAPSSFAAADQDQPWTNDWLETYQSFAPRPKAKAARRR